MGHQNVNGLTGTRVSPFRRRVDEQRFENLVSFRGVRGTGGDCSISVSSVSIPVSTSFSRMRSLANFRGSLAKMGSTSRCSFFAIGVVYVFDARYRQGTYPGYRLAAQRQPVGILEGPNRVRERPFQTSDNVSSPSGVPSPTPDKFT